ncbi:23S rRNA (adenine(1618)-N(6))-methyltransferase RlmF [Olleya marilimosa]|uniref:Ribosomal RNA large subunit methyltransferase F n=1 Tax=Olleya marilimosa TaxID=272164 RepID=A0ABR8LV49_9FLAO|nr:23S rRNA (adenine(1618)-N(6))-methyltransferase RlmF [Olleya marilimosa]MBD3863710.1 23S rRNA (adenine(1618)-N(6))-methyltransferase RlmF [Olleya marilimosa]MBD3890873.1 23S rRNA (adenine(1618)-N(6))-methyltransferase RlmF [Olleya marilimosa]
MHKKNKHTDDYDFNQLSLVHTDLESFIFTNANNKKTIDFANPKAVKALNTALLKSHYDVAFWDFPDHFLCPPIPGRVDYIHHISDLLERSNLTENITVLDIGTGANCIYPLLGNAEYNWSFIGVDSNDDALKEAQNIIDKNNLQDQIKLKKQNDNAHVLSGVLSETDKVTVTMCNPPFFKNEEDALKATTSKLKGLGKPTDQMVRNFAGQAHELWYKGGEKAFLHNYLYESSLLKTQSYWYTSLVSNKDNVKTINQSLKKLGATAVLTIGMNIGNKKSRIVAWTFLDEQQKEDWNKN